MAATKSTILIDNLYDKVHKSLSDKSSYQSIKSEFDKYMSKNIDKYMTVTAPAKKPIFLDNEKNKFISTVGLNGYDIVDCVKQTVKQGVIKNWYQLDNPYFISTALATRYYTKTNNDAGVKLCFGYMILERYPSLHHKYFGKMGASHPNPNIMEYTINNMSSKFKIKQSSSLWEAMIDIVSTAYDHFKKDIERGYDTDIHNYMMRVQTSLNSFMRKITNQYSENWRAGNRTKVETEIFEDDNYYEGDSNSYAIERISNSVVSHLVVNGPNMQLVDMAAKMNQVSVSLLRSYTQSMINDKHRDEIRQIIECILSLYLFSDEPHSIRMIGTNDFLLYCLQLYKKSNTINKDILKIKSILDKWLVDLGIMSKTSRDATVNSFRKALYVFFVLSIQKIGG